MSTLTVYFIEGNFTAGFVTIWFWTAYGELLAKRNCLADLNGQLRLQERLYARARGGPDTQSANGMMETNRMLYREKLKDYNSILRKPMNCLPALLMGFRQIKEEDI